MKALSILLLASVCAFGQNTVIDCPTNRDILICGNAVPAGTVLGCGCKPKAPKPLKCDKSCPEVNVDKMSPFSTMLTKPNKDTVTLSGTTSLGTTVPIRPPLKPCDKKYEYSAVSADSKGYIEVCVPIMHEVTEKEWQALMKKLEAKKP